MTEYTLTGPDGSQYKAEADSLDQAMSKVQGFRQQEVNQAGDKAFENAPMWAKPLLAAKDVGRQAYDTLTLGAGPKLVDKLAGTGDTEQMKVESARGRMGLAGVGMDALLAARFLPTAVPAAVRYMGGGPAARTLVGSATAAGEGAAYGGTSAGLHDQDITRGTGIGAVTGVIGNTIGNIANRAKKGYDTYVKGINYDPPNYNVTRLNPNKTPTAMDLVNVAAGKTAQSARKSSNPLAFQKEATKQFDDLATGPNKKMFTRPQKEQMSVISQGDPATNASAAVGNILSNKLLGVTMGVGTSAAGGAVPGMLSAGALLGGGRAMKAVSAGGTQEAIQNLRRMMYGTPRFVGPVSEAAKVRFSNAARQLGLDLTDEDN